jgi:hypothetical protein
MTRSDVHDSFKAFFAKYKWLFPLTLPKNDEDELYLALPDSKQISVYFYC